MSRRKAAAYSQPPETLRQALYQLVHHSGVSFERLVEAAQVKSPSYLYNASNPNLEEESHHAQMRWLVPLTQAAGNFVLVDFIEQALGRVGIALPSGEASSAPVTAEDMLALAKEFGDVAREIAEGLAGDRVIDGAEKPRCRKELYELLQKTAELWRRLGVTEDDSCC